MGESQSGTVWEAPRQEGSTDTAIQGGYCSLRDMVVSSPEICGPGGTLLVGSSQLGRAPALEGDGSLTHIHHKRHPAYSGALVWG